MLVCHRLRLWSRIEEVEGLFVVGEGDWVLTVEEEEDGERLQPHNEECALLALIEVPGLQGVMGRSWRCEDTHCLLYTSPSPRDGLLSRMPSSA